MIMGAPLQNRFKPGRILNHVSNLTTESVNEEWEESVIRGRHRQENDVALGYLNDPFTGLKAATVPYEGLFQQTLITGATGYGKTTHMVATLLQIAENGDGFCYVDSKGDGAVDLLARLPERRLDDVVVVGALNSGIVRGIDPFSPVPDDPENLEATVRNIVALIRGDSSTWSPKVDYTARLAVRLVLEGHGDMDDLRAVARGQTEAIEELRGGHHDDAEALLEFVETDKEVFEPVHRRLNRVLSGDHMHRLLTETDPPDFDDAAAEGKIIIVAAPGTRQTNQLFCSFVTGQWWDAVTRQRDGDPSETPLFLAIDEAGSAVSEGLSLQDIVSRAQGLRVGTFIGVQQLGELGAEDKSTVLGGCDNRIAFNPQDTHTANEMTAGDFPATREQLLDIDQFVAWSRLAAQYGLAVTKVRSFAPIDPVRDPAEVHLTRK